MTPEEYDFMLDLIIPPVPKSLMVLLIEHIKRDTEIKNGKDKGLSQMEILTKMKLMDEDSNIWVKFRQRKYQQQERKTACANFEAFFKDVQLNLPLNSYWATWIETDFVKFRILEPCGIEINVFAKESPNLTWDKSKKPAEPTLHYLYDENSIYLYNDFSHYQYFDFNQVKPAQAKAKKPMPFQVIVMMNRCRYRLKSTQFNR